MKTMYVLGFLFTPNYDKVVLIKKNKPAWQSGFLNGVGGKIERGETELAAIIREFEEETGMRITNWIPIARMHGDEWVVYCFKSTAAKMIEAKTMTSEEIVIMPVNQLDYSTTIQNLSWLIPICMDKDPIQVDISYCE